MSLTTLGSQIAGLNASRNDLGSTLPHSRQHEDSIGRGLSHSVQLGHFDAKKSKVFKASIMLENAGKAGDIPLVTLKENCMVSLRRLEVMDGRFGDYVKFLRINSKERLLMTRSENCEVDKILDELLHRLILRISDNRKDTNNARTSAFHVIEYLLRRYDIHLHPPLAETLLRLTVPLHEDPIFLRMLQLVDLSVLPTWSFLRPYAVPGARVAREVISKQASIDVSFLSNLCLLAKRSADLPCHVHHLSFIATVISECAAFQVKNLGDLTERTCRALLQEALGACRQSKNAALQNWGHVTASIVVETASLAEVSRDILVTSILSGVTDCNGSAQLNGLVVAFTAISQGWIHLGHPLQEMQFFLSDEHGMKNDIFHEFLGLSNLSSQLGHLFCNERSGHVSRWIACLLVVGTKLLQEDATTRVKQVQILILDLIREPKLRSLWISASKRYLESFAAVFVEIFARKGEDAMLASDDFEEAVFRLLYSIDSSAFENGIASASFRIDGQKRKNILCCIQKLHCGNNQIVSANQPLLSPLIELNHKSDQSGTRLIQEIIEEHKENQSTIYPRRTEAKSLLDLLNHDANNEVAIEAGKTLIEFLKSHKDCDTTKEIGEAALQAAYKWFNKQQDYSFQRIDVLVQVFRLLESIGLGLTSRDSECHLFVRIIECLGAFSSSANDAVSQHSSERLRNILGIREAGTVVHNIHALMVSDLTILNIFRRDVSGEKDRDLFVRRRCVKSILEGSVENFRLCRNFEKRQLYATEMVKYCMWVAATFADELQPTETTLLRSCMLTLGHDYAPSYQQLRQLTTELASNDATFFSTDMWPVIQMVCASICGKSGSKIAGLNIVMDIAVFASKDAKDTSVKNMLSMATMYIRGGKATAEEVHCAIAAALCFLENMDIDIREKAVDLMNDAGNFLAARTDKEQSCLIEVCVFIAGNKANILIGGATRLPWYLASVMSRSKRQAQLREVLLGLCVKASGAPFAQSDLSKNNDIATGGYFTAASLLTATELAGEEFFPLAKRWELAGSPIMKYIQSHLLEAEVIPASLESLIRAAVRMLKGVKIMNFADRNGQNNYWTADAEQKDPNLSSKGDVENFFIPYAEDMENTILSILENDGKLKIARLLQQYLVVTVFGSQSWTSRIFGSLSSSFREKIARKILSGIAAGVDGFDRDTLMNLPLGASEATRMIESAQCSQVEISYLSEYILINHKRLNRESPGNKLITGLFGNLEISSSVTNIVSGEKNYLCEAILSAVLELIKSSSGEQLRAETSETEVQTWVAILLHILERNSTSHEELQSIWVHKSCITVLECLCPLFPRIVVKTLIPAMKMTICDSIGSNASGFLIDCLVMIVTQFLKFAELVGLFPADMFQAFAFHSMTVDEKQRITLYQSFIKALSRMYVTGLDSRIPGAFVSSCLSMELYLRDNDLRPTISSPLCNIASMILNDSSIAIRTISIIEMLACGKEIISKHIHGKETTNFESAVKVEDLILLSVNGGKETCESVDLIAHPNSLLVCNLLVESVWKNTQTTSFQTFLRNLDSSGSKTVLPFWQDLILIQSACKNIFLDCRQGDKAFWETLLRMTDAILGNLHSSIPVHIFLAFATSVIKTGETEELRCIAVRSIADRAICFNPIDAEATLLRETIPFLSEELGSGRRSQLQQSVLITIEAVARKLCLGNGFQPSPTLSDQLVEVTFKAAALIEIELPCAGTDFEKITPPSREIICIASLCASTCIRVCGPRALKALSALMKTHIATLCVSNDFIGYEGFQQRTKKEARLMQVSAIHSIIAVVETLPQFLAPYLKDMLAPLALPSKALREQHESLEIVDNLDTALVANIPARLLVPSVLEAIDSNDFGITSQLALVSLLTSTVSCSSRQIVARHATGLLRVVTSTLEHSVHPARQSCVLRAASDLFLGFVLKLSEFQLRSLYLKLREWKGDIDNSDLYESAWKRAAFWSISATLATNLRSIYLACLSLVFSDLIKELESAATILFQCSHVPGASETKRQRLEQRKHSMSPVYDTTPVEKSLLCLQVSLRSDAHDGGRWIREGESHNFERLLNPLCKLLQSAYPPHSASTRTYERLVQGTDPQSASVVTCIVSLALAAGDEQLWKPLNHRVLQAASCDTRAEVRKAGVKCLASLIRTIGEEYMIFVPECLPVLSELLEDTDQSVASLAKDCIALSEQFLGENLQYSL